MTFLQTGKEVIADEATALIKLSESLDDKFESACRKIIECPGHVIVTGMGKSGHIGQKIAATFSSMGTPSFYLHPAEASHGDLGVITGNNIVIAISNSGESKELFDILEYCKRNGIFLIGITSKVESTLGKYSDITLVIPLDREACKLNLAPTNSTTMTLALGDALSVAVCLNKNFTKTDFSKFHPGGKLGKLLVKVKDVMRPANQVAIVDISTPFQEVILKISEKLGGCAIVVEELGINNTIAGVVTDGDIRRYLSKQQHNADILMHTINNFMSTAPHTTIEDTLAVDAIHIMNKNRITSMPVIDNLNQVVGLLHIHDLVNLGF